MAYTKGPWNLNSEDWIEASHTDNDGQKIAVIEYGGCGSHEAFFPNEADKALVVSAPDLLECQTMGQTVNTPDFLEWLADRLVYRYGESPNIDFVLSLRERAKAGRLAMNKALGIKEQ